MKNRIVIAGLCLMAAAPFAASADAGVSHIAQENGKVLLPGLVEERCQSENVPAREFEFCRKQKVDGRDSESNEFAHAVLSESGTLASVLGERVYKIDSIAVEGPVNDADFNTLWDSSFNGRLKIINLENAVVEGGKIPEYAFFHIDVQVNWETWVITTIPLEKVILPHDITEIGKDAFGYAINLEEINFPSTLRYIGKSAFTDCISLRPEQLVFHEGLEKLDHQAFYQCRGLDGEIKLPSSVTWIDSGVFYQCRITDINIPPNLEYLGCFAFAGSQFKTAILPDNAYLCPDGCQFYNNWELTEAHLPDNLEFVPQSIFSGCISLQLVNVPSQAIVIGEFAYDGAPITEINFPETLESIGQDAFQGCKLNTVVLPSSLKRLCDRAFALCSGLKSIYCKATVPPEYVPAQGYESDRTPFASVNPMTPVYVPVGAKQQYESAQGWDYMTNFIEIDSFPSSGFDGVVFEGNTQDNRVYDLSGRRVESPATGQIYIKNGKKTILK